MKIKFITLLTVLVFALIAGLSSVWFGFMNHQDHAMCPVSVASTEACPENTAAFLFSHLATIQHLFNVISPFGVVALVVMIFLWSFFAITILKIRDQQESRLRYLFLNWHYVVETSIKKPIEKFIRWFFAQSNYYTTRI